NFYFFFQAEDGIRDRTVTGVQTCALPISDVFRGPALLWFDGSEALQRRSGQRKRKVAVRGGGGDLDFAGRFPRISFVWRSRWNRSEERRVGKECRCWVELGKYR